MKTIQPRQMLSVLSQIGPCSHEACFKIRIGEGVCANMLAASRSVDESVIAYINAHMGYSSSLFSRKEYQVTLPQPAFIDRGSDLILPPGGMREIQTVESVDRHGQAAAVKSFVG